MLLGIESMVNIVFGYKTITFFGYIFQYIHLTTNQSNNNFVF